MTLRTYQSTLKNKIIASWNFGYQNILAVAPCGAGKTVMMADIFHDHTGPAIAIAHRQELVGQISMAMARAGLTHRIIAPPALIKFIVTQQIKRLGSSFYHPSAPLAVAGVDTLIRRTDQLGDYLKQVSLWQTDEAHHLLTDNKWGAAVSHMPTAQGVGWTATPLRADKRSLARLQGGVFDHMVEGPAVRWLIDHGYLADYRIVGQASDIDLTRVDISKSTGDFNSTQLRDEAHKSHIVGDVVKSYLRFAPGKRGVTFAVDVALAQEHVAAYAQAGVPAGVIHAKTPDLERTGIIDDYARGDLKQVVNVDVLGEGYDCPGIECVSLARPTSSIGLAVQQMMRALRQLEGKSFAWIIDHVGNVVRHGLPDAPRVWTLNGLAPRDGDAEIPIRTCPNPDCFRVFESWSKTCPYCNFKPEAQGRERPEQIEGDLIEFGPDLIAKLRREAEIVMSPDRALPHHAGVPAVKATMRRHDEHREAQGELRTAIAWWAGVRRDAHGDDDSTSYKRFYRRFGVDVLTAQSLKTAEAKKLHDLIWSDINDHPA